jgi:hypothetical protein
MAQGERDARSQAGRDQEEAHQQAQKLAAQLEKTWKKAKSKRIRTREAEEKKTKGGKGASGWVQVPMRDDRGQVLYNQSGRPRYHPQDGHQDGQTKKKKKPPPMRPNSPPSPTTPMATSTPATRALTRTRTTPRCLQDYIHGAELDSDSLGLLPIQDYDQSDLRNLLNQSSDYVQMRIQEQEEELRARNARDQAVIQKRLSKGPRDASPREDKGLTGVAIKLCR